MVTLVCIRQQRKGRPMLPYDIYSRLGSLESTVVLRNAQELQILRLEQRHRMTHTLRENRLELGPERSVGVSAREIRLRHVGDRRTRVPKHRRPLLDRLIKVLRVERRVPAVTQSAPRVTPHPTPGGKNTHAVPCQTCIFGRAPSYPGYASYTRCAHCAPVSTSSPSEHCEFQLSSGCPGSEKQPSGTPESTMPAWKRSGYAPASTFVIIAPEDVPTAKTRVASTPQFCSA